MPKRTQAPTPVANQIPVKTSWNFFAVLGAIPSEFKWQWQKQGGGPVVTSPPFDFYFDCITDARVYGYAGPLPPGAKVARQQLPFDPAETGRALAALSAKSNNIVMTVKAIPAVDVKTGRTRDRSPVS